jgi:hypothetical protein
MKFIILHTWADANQIVEQVVIGLANSKSDAISKVNDWFDLQIASGDIADGSILSEYYNDLSYIIEGSENATSQIYIQPIDEDG